MACVFAAVATLLIFTRLAVLSRRLLFVSGLLGMIGWVVWFAYAKNIDAGSGAVTLIAYSQVLAITAWTVCLVASLAVELQHWSTSALHAVCKLVTLGAGVVAFSLYITACVSKYWTEISFPDFSTNFNLRFSPFMTDNFDGKYPPYGLPSLPNLSMIHTTAAFTIMALVVAACATVHAYLGNAVFSSALLVVSGLLGMIAWTVWYAAMANCSFSTSFVSASGSDTITTTQTLVIAAWTMSVVFGAVTGLAAACLCRKK